MTWVSYWVTSPRLEFVNGGDVQMIRVHYQDKDAVEMLGWKIKQWLEWWEPREVLVIAIGTCRSVGDSLGPLVGTNLAELKRHGLFLGGVYGTVDDPVHAENLAGVLQGLEARVRDLDVAVIAVDASMGSTLEHVGVVTARRGPLHPGTGVGKDLPPVGDIGVYGCVAAAAPELTWLALETVPLALVVKMVWVISQAICRAVADALSHADGRALACCG